MSLSMGKKPTTNSNSVDLRRSQRIAAKSNLHPPPSPPAPKIPRVVTRSFNKSQSPGTVPRGHSSPRVAPVPSSSHASKNQSLAGKNKLTSKPTKKTTIQMPASPKLMGPGAQWSNNGGIPLICLDFDDDEITSSSNSVPGQLDKPLGDQAQAACANESISNNLENVTEQLEVMLTFENSNCSFCTENLAIGDGILLLDCCCTFCRACLTTLVQNSSSNEILCPFNSTCGGRLFPREIKAVVPPEVYQQYAKRADNEVKKMMLNIFQCKTKGCRGCCEYETSSKIFLCGDCDKSNCLKCKAIHEGLECKEYQLLLSNAIKQGKTAEEAQEFIMSQVTSSGWEQVLGNVSQWMGTNTSSQGYTNVLEQMTNLDLWLSTREFECPVCICPIPAGGGIILQDCLHTVCKECAIGLVEHAEEPVVKCPYQDGNYSCTSFLKPREIKALVSPEQHEIFLTRSVKQAESAIPNSFHCKTPDCGGWCVFEEGAQTFKCQLCKKRNCLACEVIHENVTCQDYKNRLVQNANDEVSKKKLEELIAKGECMRCPTCKITLEKMSGCDWMVCAVCKTEICWATRGPRWGPKGNGDTSGGCKCRIDNKKCTPTCGNCH